MTYLNGLEGARVGAGGYKVDVSRGQRIGRGSSEWFSRPADERFLSFSALFESVRGRTERSRTRVVDSAAIRVEANRDHPERLALVPPGATTMASSAGVSTVLLGTFGPIGASAVVVRSRHLRTVFWFRPYRTARERVLSFDAWSSARTHGVVRAPP